jgi:large subunit ribosomal protein L16
MVFPDKPITARAEESRMGSGKGAPQYWVAVVKPGKVLFELSGVPDTVAQQALRMAAYKLPIRTKLISAKEIQ